MEKQTAASFGEVLEEISVAQSAGLAAFRNFSHQSERETVEFKTGGGILFDSVI